MAITSMTHKWVISSLVIIFVLLFSVLIGVSFGLKRFYYSNVEQYIYSRATITYDYISDQILKNGDALKEKLKYLIKNFKYKDKIEIMAIDIDGNILLNSSGFPYIFDVDKDYKKAEESINGITTYISYTPNVGGFMSVCVIIPKSDSDIHAVRFVANLDNIDVAISRDMLNFTILAIFFFIFIFIFGYRYTGAVVLQIRNIGTVARKIATGDFTAKAERSSSDELGELCDMINNMGDDLAKSDKLKHDFISGVSHELRTPLTAIKGWGETLTMTNPSDTEMFEKGMKVIVNETRRLSSMVEDLLDFSKMQNGRFILVNNKTDVLAELEESLLIYTDKIKKDEIKIIYNSPEFIPYIFGDKDRLKQVFINVIDNAIKYSGPKAIIYIDAIYDKDFITISVKDNGCGIGKADLPFIKQKFYKANFKKRGSGIGLSLSSEIITLHGGSLELESEENIGTTVFIKIPINLKKGESRDPEVKQSVVERGEYDEQ